MRDGRGTRQEAENLSKEMDKSLQGEGIDKCTMKNFKSTAKELNLEFACTGQHGIRAQISIVDTYTSTALTNKHTARLIGKDGSMETITTTKGKWIGACTDAPGKKNSAK